MPQVSEGEIGGIDREIESFSVDSTSAVEYKTHQEAGKLRIAPGVQLLQRLTGGNFSIGTYRILVCAVIVEQCAGFASLCISVKVWIKYFTC